MCCGSSTTTQKLDPHRTNFLIATNFKISLCIAKHCNPLSDGNINKTALFSASNSLYHSLLTKVNIIQQISESPLIRNYV